MITPDLFYIYWEDTSGIIRSHRYVYEEQEDWNILFRYVYTLAKPLCELPTRDSTMKYDKIADRWTIKCGRKTYCELIDKTFGQSRQTCVFVAETNLGKKRVIEDLWIDEQQRFKEADLVKKAKGVPGAVQSESSINIKKKRCVLMSLGKKLQTRRSLFQIIKAVHDSLGGEFDDYLFQINH